MCKMIPVETVQEWGKEEERAAKGVNSSMIYLIHCKNFCIYANVPSPSTIIKKKRKKSLP
jgi:hypothetical protein